MPKGIPYARVRYLEAHEDERLTDDDHKVSAGLLHFCYDWDGLLIDRSDPEFSACSCEFEPGYPDAA